MILYGYRGPELFLYFAVGQERWTEMKAIRKRMDDITVDMKLERTDLDYESYLQVVENNLINKVKSGIIERSAI